MTSLTESFLADGASAYPCYAKAEGKKVCLDLLKRLPGCENVKVVPDLRTLLTGTRKTSKRCSNGRAA